MAQQNINYSVLPWYNQVERQNWRKFYAQDQVWPLVARERRLIPFQVIRTDGLGTAIDSFKLIDANTGDETEIIANMTSAGLGFTNYGTYDIIRFPGTVLMAALTIWPEGHYYCKMTDTFGHVWWSEVFWVRHYVSDLVQVQYWHDRRFKIPGGHIDYSEPFYNFIYLHAVINRPAYIYEEEAENRSLVKFIIHQATKKQYRFVVLVPEFMADVLRLIPLHYNVVILYDGIEYAIDDITINLDEWIQPGHLIPAEFIFNTDTVVEETGRMTIPGEGHTYDQSAYNDSFN